MQIIRRTVAILVAALLVAGVTFGVAQSSGAQSLNWATPMRGTAASGTINADTAGAGSPRPGGFEHEGNRSPSLFGAVEMLKDLVIIGVIVGLVALVTRATRGRWPGGAQASPKLRNRLHSE
jgi:hypothetical protein